MDPIVDERVVKGCVLADQHFNCFLGGHSPEEGSYVVDLAVPIANHLQSVLPFE